jgi:Amt family ammonium transporter
MELMVWAVIAAAGALVIRVGFAVHAAGMARAKNSAGAVMRHLCDACVALLAFWALGYAIFASQAPVLGLQWRALLGLGQGYAAGSFVTAALVLVATGIVPGVLAERARFWPALANSALLAAVVVPLAMLWTTGNGWLVRLGYHDPGGAGWLHLVGAVTAAVGARFVGARTGKFNRDGSSSAIPGHSVPLAGIAVVILLAGFFALLAGLSPADTAAVGTNVLVAAAAAGLASAVLGQIRFYKPDVHLTCAGIVGGLVAVSAGADQLGSLGAVIVGAVAGVLVPLALLTVDLRLRIDDPSGNIAVHGVGAIWGLLATPLFARGLDLPHRLRQLGAHALAILALAALAGGLSLVLWTILKRLTRLRASEADEFDGLDIAEHDLAAYPDFQQTMIKSYHLREV